MCGGPVRLCQCSVVTSRPPQQQRPHRFGPLRWPWNPHLVCAIYLPWPLLSHRPLKCHCFNRVNHQPSFLHPTWVLSFSPTVATTTYKLRTLQHVSVSAVISVFEYMLLPDIMLNLLYTSSFSIHSSSWERGSIIVSITQERKLRLKVVNLGRSHS